MNATTSVSDSTVIFAFIAFVTFLITVIGAVGGAWWRIEAVVKTAKSEALTKADAAYTLGLLVQAQLAEHKLHVAEKYITKAGLRETTEQIITAVNGVKTDVHALNERIDRIFEQQQPAPPPRPRRTS